jgi:hypothetical protein
MPVLVPAESLWDGRCPMAAGALYSGLAPGLRA